MIKSAELKNFLSFGADSEKIELRPLNVIIGRNGSGKSNFIEAIELLRNMPSDMTKPIREGGGISDWLYKGSKGEKSPATMTFVLENRAIISKNNSPELLHQITFADEGQRFRILDEKITTPRPKPGKDQPYIYYDYAGGWPVLNVKDDRGDNGYTERRLSREDISTEQSILQQRSDLDSYPEITVLAKELKKIKLYRQWAFGRDAAMREPVKTDALNDFLAEDCTNLALILNEADFNGTKRVLLEKLRLFYEDVDDYIVRLDGGTAQLFFKERGLRTPVPATRLSDGTLRYLCLLCILLHPSPPPLICIEEPELGLHPDILPTVGRLLYEASKRCQLIVTTHSPALIDPLSEHPDCVLIAEKEKGETTLTRLDKEELSPWLKKYRLGELWTQGEIGGNIW